MSETSAKDKDEDNENDSCPQDDSILGVQKESFNLMPIARSQEGKAAL